MEVQRDPYQYLLSQSEKQSAQQILPRLFCVGTAMGVASLYYLTRHNELQKFMRFSITAEMIFGVVWRAAAAGLVAEVASRRVFVNYIRLKEH